MTDFGPLPALLSEPQGGSSGRFYGVAVGVVTNNNDPEKLGRLKLKLPWLSEVDESHWARMAAPMAGNGRGFFVLPEVGDEVLVAFEHGRVEFPYVLGALWNGKDKPPEDGEGGKNNRRTLTSRSGHVIRLDDTEGKEKIEIVDKTGKNLVRIDSARNAITIQAESDVTIDAKGGKLSLSGKSVEIKSGGALEIDAKGTLDAKASGKVNIKGETVNVN